MERKLVLVWLAVACVATSLGALRPANAAVDPDNAVPVATDGISGVVNGPRGPEAGVWVIAETRDLPTRFIKIVVTDGHGRFVLPQLPKASYKVWIRGYGLIDSDPVQAHLGEKLTLAATTAPNAAAAAKYYPADYWWALVRPPLASEFPGTGPKGNGISPMMRTQHDWLGNLRYCMGCHQVGDLWTRHSADSEALWNARLQFARPPGDRVIANKGVGYAAFMNYIADRFGRESLLKTLASWGKRIDDEGALPTEAPARPTGRERDVVISIWDIGHGTYIHDEVASDRHNPSLNAGGPIYAIESDIGKIAIFNPATMASSSVVLPGAEDSYPHSIMMDRKGRLWVADLGELFDPGIKPGPRPTFCSNGSIDKYARYFPQSGLASEVYTYDPSTRKVTMIPTCFVSQHLWFANDKDSTLYFAGDSVAAWIDTKVWDKTHDPQKAQGWCPFVLNTKSGAGKLGDDMTIVPDRAQWNVLGTSAAPNKDTRMALPGLGTYGLGVDPVDGSVWYGDWTYPGGVIRFTPGPHPPQTCKSEYYQPPKLANGGYPASLPHDIGFDSNGIAWVTFTSGQIGRFDRSKCRLLSGPGATGEQCSQGWTIYDDPKTPRISGTKISADFYYQMYVDQDDVFGLGRNVPFVPGSNSDSMKALIPGTGTYLTFRVPYPMGFYARWIDGRIDNPKAGWKGRGLWSTFATVPMWHQEAGSGGTTSSELVKFQLRPDPLAH